MTGLEIPRNLGAVVEDADGQRFVRGEPSPTQNHNFDWYSPGDRDWFADDYVRAVAVRVLSEGVPT